MRRSNLPYFFLGLAAVLAVAALALLILRPGVEPEPPTEQAATQPAVLAPAKAPEVKKEEPPLVPDAPEDLEAVINHLGIGLSTSSPEELVQQIAKAFETGDMTKFARLLGRDALSPESAERLTQLAASPLRLRQPDGVREVGELELNTRTRWSFELADREPGRDRIFLDLKRAGGKWSVDKITLPPIADQPIPEAALADSLGVADGFIRALLNLNFEKARAFVDSAKVSDAKIAGLCILFEEGEYRMRKSKPLRSMFQRADTVGYLANVETTDGKQHAQFALTLRRPQDVAEWRIAEINLDQLLVEYSRRVAGGDVYYSPLVKNPAGGDTLALYFEFDDDEINPRTRRQLEIVTAILKSDSGKKITLSGHTDAFGTDDYNNSLSSRRATVVQNFLIQAGVNTAQIISLAKGASQPRRPNYTESGEDNPEGRRANRRTEIYLDF